MAHSRHHGRHSFEGKNELISRPSYNNKSDEKKTEGRFGRMFPELSPLYIDPKILRDLGNAEGPMDSKNESHKTDSVPLGMIFFGQFVDHDITFDTHSNFSEVNAEEKIQNSRTATLDLDSIFGRGPEEDPHLYDDPNERKLYLLTGNSNNNIGQGKNEEKHDLMRNGHGTAMIGDPRNDENRVISQFQLAMIRFYNVVYHKLLDEIPDDQDKSDADIADELYEEARREITWHYQWIVVNHFLPVICGKKVVNDILSRGRKWYKPTYPMIPVEFSVAAYRFGHSMIAQEMHIKKGGDVHNIFSSEFGRGFTPIKNAKQVIDWEVFFDFGEDFQKAEKLDTKLASDLLDLVFIESDDPAARSLATRNLRRGQSFLLPSGESVARHMKRDQKEIDRVTDKISEICNNHDIDLPDESPLWFYILAEAEEIGRTHDKDAEPGEGLGPVGATIVAEVIIGLLELDKNSYLGSNRDWTPKYGDNYDFTIPDMMKMAKQELDLDL